MMKRAAIVFSRDRELQAYFGALLAKSYDCPVTGCSEFASAAADLEQHPQATLLLDLRTDWYSDDAEQLLLHAAARARPVRVIPVSDGYYPLKIAALADLASPACYLYPGNLVSHAGNEQVLACFAEAGEPRRIPAAQIAEADGVKFRTHTEELFPMLSQLTKVAVHDVTLLLVGETGTGKTTLAHLVHRLSPRRDEPFQTVACGALPKDLIESELFGHVRGAFTGADRNKIGRFEAAGQGTLLLDEIDVLGPKEQANLLRVIEAGEYEPVGSTETRTSHARLIVASNVDLKTLTDRGQFRSDLYYRLNVLEFRIPPLRDRPLDIVSLAVQFIEELCEKHKISIRRVHREFLRALKAYPWPGNLRELKNQLQRSVLFCRNQELNVADLSPSLLEVPAEAPSPAPVVNGPKWSLEHHVAASEQEILHRALRAHGYSKTLTARALGISRVGLYKKMRRYGMLTPKTDGDESSA
jgi:DNA-binding NtrC family response regulator